MSKGRVKFERDIKALVSRLSLDMETLHAQKLCKLKDDLIEMHKENIVKINHSVMELVCAKYLIQKGYDVQVEYALNDILTCDLHAIKGLGNFIIEIETGYIPPEHAMDPLTYTYTRLASKIIRYSSFSGKFAIGVPPHYILPLPRTLTLPPKKRAAAEVERIKNLCDYYYQKPPVTYEGICNARIHEIYVIDVDHTQVIPMDPEAYTRRVLHKAARFALEEEPVVEQLQTQKSLQETEKIDHYCK
ncbi:MAG: hypothetical protein NWF04_04425 [Candidatus Bathyarchaeota archaeon]|nr:hypothetical protein [Candidatus Bathyarchaeota archaeon]